MKLQAKVLLTLIVAVSSVAGCAADAPPKQGVRGEDCKSSGDCGSGLVCLSFTCANASSGLARAENECVEIECASAADCCGENATECDLDCRNEHCVQTCSDDAECVGACVGGVCVQCGTDDDCPSGFLCLDQECDPGCRLDVECPPLYACQAGTCVDVGCKSNRECVALLGSVRAECRESRCVSPCSSDGECNDGASALSICVGGECAPIGCETTSECRAGSPSGGENGRLECRPRATAAP